MLDIFETFDSYETWWLEQISGWPFDFPVLRLNLRSDDWLTNF